MMDRTYSVVVAVVAYRRGVVQRVPLTLVVDFVVAQRVDQRVQSKLVGFVVVDSGSDQSSLLQTGKNPASEVGSATDFRNLTLWAAHCRKLNLVV